MIIPIIEVIQTYLFVSCFLKRKVRFGKVLDWLVLIGVSEVGTIGNHYFQDANINILIAVIEIIILLSFFDGGVKRKILAGLLYLVFAFLAEGVVAVGLSRAYDIRGNKWYVKNIRYDVSECALAGLLSSDFYDRCIYDSDVYGDAEGCKE